jgi:hypothetical protein
MIYCFPHEAALLPRAKLSYVNLPGILSDGKRDRASRIEGFVAVQLGERCYLVFLRGGEPFHAACIQPGERAPAALSEVVRLASTESERGEAGHIGFYTATECQLRAMLATIVNPAEAWGEPVDAARPELLFPRLRERGFTGVLELCEGGTFHYLEFCDGAFRTGYFSGREAGVPVPDFLRTVFEAARGRLCASIYPPLAELPVLAAPGLVDLYRRVIGGVLRELTQAAGRETATALLGRGQGLAAVEHPEVAAFSITSEGRVVGDPVASPDVLTAAVATWLTEALIAAADHHGVDPGAIVERVGRDSRYVLQEHGFFNRLPWALAI